MLSEDTIEQVLKALLNAGLIVCERKYIGPGHPASMPSNEYVIGRIEESGGLSDETGD